MSITGTDREQVLGEPHRSDREPDGRGSSRNAAKLPVILVLHQLDSSPGHIGQWLQRAGHPLDIRRPRFGDPLPETLEQHAGAVIFGGPMSANDPDDFIRRETDWIGVALREEKPFLGVCLGAQMMARLLSARVFTCPESTVEIGYHPLRPTTHGRAICDWPERVYQWHGEGFDLPAGARLLAETDGSFPSQAYAYGPSAIGIQFHPEITHAMVARWSTGDHPRFKARGAQPRHGQMADHVAYGPRVRAWLDALMSKWVANELETAGGG